MFEYKKTVQEENLFDILETGMVVKVNTNKKYLVIKQSRPNGIHVNLVSDDESLVYSFDGVICSVVNPEYYLTHPTEIVEVRDVNIDSLQNMFGDRYCDGEVVWEKPVDWSKVSVDTPVVVNNNLLEVSLATMDDIKHSNLS